MNMDIKAPYLEAIQSIPGKVPGEKQKTINLIARNVAGTSESKGETVPHFPELLKPLVQIEVAKLLHQHEGIIEAFKSEDLSIIYRAFQAKWFFTGANVTLVDVKYMVENLFPEISHHARLKIIKRFGIFLQNVEIGAELFTVILQKYGVEAAIPLLTVCKEQFAFKMIMENKIKLSMKMIKRLYAKYPKLVIEYLMLTKSGPDNVRDPYEIFIFDYTDFLPIIAVKHFDDFMRLYDKHNGLNVQLGNKAATIFISKCMNRLMENPKQYLKLVPLKLVCRRLSADDFIKMFQDAFPKDKESFKFSELYETLQYFKYTEVEKLDFVLTTFQKVYGEDLLKCQELVTPELLQLLPRVTRVEQARLKLASDKEWHLEDEKRSWRCYLSTSESIPLIKAEIGCTSDDTRRSQLLKLMVYTCKVNKDKDAILITLNYVYERHRNERDWFVFEFLSSIRNSFDLFDLTADHWVAINKFIKLAEVQDKLFDNSTLILEITEDALHYCFLNDLSTDDCLQMYIKVSIQIWFCKWNILTSNPKWEKKCLDLFIDTIPEKYPFNNKFWTLEQTIKVTSTLSSALYEYNGRNSKSKKNVKHLSIRDYPWLFEKIQQLILSDWKEEARNKGLLLQTLKSNEKDLFNLWLPNIEQFWKLDISILLHILKQQPQRILDHWKECFDKIQDELTPHSRDANVFITKCRWFQDLPIRFFGAALELYRANENITPVVETLAMMLDGQSFTEIITPVIPKDEKMDLDADNARDMYKLQLAIASNLRRLNPPVSLDVVGSFCVGDYLQMAIRSLFSVCNRVSASTVIAFAKILTERRVSVMKHGIRLMYMVSPLQDLYNFLVDIWKIQSHKSIRAVVFKKIYKLFVKQPNFKSWDMIRICILNLNTNDDSAIFEILIQVKKVPNEFIYEFLQIVFDVLEKLRNNSEAPDSDKYFKLSCRLIRNLDLSILNIIPEEYTQHLMTTYLFDFNYNPDVFKSGKELANCYLLESTVYNHPRFNFFSKHFHACVKQYWDKRHPQDQKFFPMNFMVHELFDSFVTNWITKYDPKIFERLLEIFTLALLPQQDMTSYLNLVYCVEFYNSVTAREFGVRLSRVIPYLIHVFTQELTLQLGMQLKQFLAHRKFPDTNNEELWLVVMETLAPAKNVHCTVIAAMFLRVFSTKTFFDRSENVISILRCIEHSAVASLLNTHLNTLEYALNS